MLKKHNLSLLLMLAATTSLPLQAANNAGYVIDSSGDIVRSASGECWRDQDWTVENAIAECEGGIKKESDSDNDGIIDGIDACPGTTAGITVNAKGCEKDSDNDGVVDSKDNCADTTTGISVDSKGCAKDSDSDGIADSNDKCPDTAKGVKIDASGCAVSLDDDNDGIINSLDKCAGTKPDTVVNNQGCELKADISLDNVQFKTGTAELSTKSSNILDNIARILKQNKHLNFEVAGHTDNTGNYQSNVELSEKRAKSVRQYLIDQGVSPERLSTQGYGPDKPVASNDTRQGRSKNRRVELKLN